jgi:DNA-binding response OmpR family regulator
MKRSIIAVVDSDRTECDSVCTLIGRANYETLAFRSLDEMGDSLDGNAPQVLILDLDNLPVDNRLFRSLKASHPSMHIIGLSSRPHPELREAMSTDIAAAVRKPLHTEEQEELVYWIRSLLGC